MSFYTESFHNCVHLLNKYRWMAGDTKTPQIAHKHQKERKMSIQRPVTQEERDLILKLYHEGKCYKDIIAATGRSHPVIIRTLKKAGIKPRSNRRQITDEDESNIAKLYHQGMRPFCISRQLGIPSTTVHKRIRRLEHLPRNNENIIKT